MPPPKRYAVGGLTAYLLLAGTIVLAVFWKFLTFRAAYLFQDIGADSINVLYPQLRHLFDYWHTDGLPGWSFNQGLGQNIYPFSWNDPFFLLLIPFRGENLLPYGFAYMETVKLLTAGSLFYLFLREASFARRPSVAGAVLYSFSGYIVLAGAWSVFSTEAVLCALLLYGVERLLKRHDWRLVPVALALIAHHLPFLLFPYAIFFGFYSAVRFLDQRGWKPGDCCAFLFRFAALSALGATMAGVSLLSDVRQMMQSPRAAGGASLFQTLSRKPVFATADPVAAVTALLRLFSDDILGTGSSFRGRGNYLEAPLLYCGLVGLLLAPQAFAFMDRRRRALYGALSALVLLPVFFPYFRYAFWAFSGDYYRSLSLFFVVVLLLLAAKAWTRIEESARVDVPVLIASLSAALVLLYIVVDASHAPVDETRRAVVAVLLVLYAGLIFLMGARKHARLAGPALLLLLGAEAAWASWTTLDTRQVLTDADLAERIGYNDYTVDALASLSASDASFYRVEKNYRSNPTAYRGLNDPKAQGYFGTTSYAQFNQASYVAFLAAADVIDPSKERDTRWLLGLRSREKLMSLVGVKYFLAKGLERVPARFLSDPVGTYGDVTAYRNSRTLPLGFTYDRCLPLAEFRKLDDDAKDAALLDAFVADDAAACLGFGRFDPRAATKDEAKRYDAAIKARTADTFSITARSQNSIVGSITLREKKLLFFPIPFDQGWSARVDGKTAVVTRADIGFMALPLEPGTHRVELRFTPPLRAEGTLLSLAAFAIYAWMLTRRKRS